MGDNYNDEKNFEDSMKMKKKCKYMFMFMLLMIVPVIKNGLTLFFCIGGSY